MKGPKTMLLRTLFTLSVLTPVAAHAESPAVEAPVDTESTGVGGYVALEWRAFALAGHLSHGPGFEAGAILLDGHLKVGLSGFARPGPINPEVFEVQASGGQSYKGSQTLSLRSDGGTIGVFVAPSFAVSRNLQLDVPLWFGQAAFGFYLHGDDRDTRARLRLRPGRRRGTSPRVALGRRAVAAPLRRRAVPADLRIRRLRARQLQRPQRLPRRRGRSLLSRV